MTRRLMDPAAIPDGPPMRYGIDPYTTPDGISAVSWQCLECESGTGQTMTADQAHTAAAIHVSAEHALVEVRT